MMNQKQEYARELRSYIVGFGLALLLSIIPFALVAWGGGARIISLWIIAAFALVQIIVHFRFFLHIDLSGQKREDLQLILFSALLFAIMAGGTIWIMNNLHMRMM
jgi:cytochrome o ubiquinol oxidase operon protein cyoD